MAIFKFLPKSGPYLAYFTPVPSLPRWARDPKIFFQRWLYTTGSYAEKNFGIFSAHLRYLPILSFLLTTQLAVFRIEYNAFSKAKFRNFQKLLKLNIYLQTIIIDEKTQFELNLTSFKWGLPRLAPSGSPSAWLGKSKLVYEINFCVIILNFGWEKIYAF